VNDELLAGEPAVLAIDGGNSKTEVALVAGDGTLLAQVRGDRSNFQGIGMDEAFRVLDGLVRTAARDAGVADGALIARHTSACLAGADLPDEEQLLTDLVHAQGWTTSSLVVNDTFAVLRAGVDDDGGHWGVGVTCGAGINCVGVAPDGETTRFLSLGDISGDWGGGGDLARDALWWAARAEDGRGPDTELRLAVPAHFGLDTVREVTIGAYQNKLGYSDLHGLAPVLFEVALHGDQVASDLLVRQADEVANMAITAARRLGLTQAEMPVALGGSILTARHPLLSARLSEQLAAGLPAAMPRIVDVPPVAGAALLGLDRVGAPPQAAARLRACYADSPVAPLAASTAARRAGTTAGRPARRRLA
jgi:N-acetylglucosamine kinase-like BadF-type ATPase